jgi:hypothetical protein
VGNRRADHGIGTWPLSGILGPSAKASQREAMII